MPQPTMRFKKGLFYKRNDGAWIKNKQTMKKVGVDSYQNRQHYSKKSKGLDRKRSARKSNKSKHYPQAFD